MKEVRTTHSAEETENQQLAAVKRVTRSNIKHLRGESTLICDLSSAERTIHETLGSGRILLDHSASVGYIKSLNPTRLTCEIDAKLILYIEDLKFKGSNKAMKNKP